MRSFLKSRSFFIGTIIMVLLAIVLNIAACSANGENIFSEKQNGKTVKLNVGDVFKVKLESNQTTGYSWQLSDKIKEDVVISFVSSVYETSSEDKNLVGSGGYETFTFEAKSAGKTQLVLSYVRPWEEGVPLDNIYSLNIVVQMKSS